ncbi:uncharacterized protein G2W53_004699 [Senna tora]|uniref:Uncharacterized protein n=1 Tax=Senna tora TaxID=362788 RepID=A0A835CID6_9FABA|nr:uncharacterized protein G2W53_004699 [Senna tora]
MNYTRRNESYETQKGEMNYARRNTLWGHHKTGRVTRSITSRGGHDETLCVTRGVTIQDEVSYTGRNKSCEARRGGMMSYARRNEPG